MNPTLTLRHFSCLTKRPTHTSPALSCFTKGVSKMNRTQRILVVALSGALLLSGFALGRVTDTQRTSAEENKAALVQPSPAALATAPEERAFYLQDFKTGYDAGYNTALTGQMPSMANTDRTGYTEGFKQGYSNAYQAQPIAP